MQTVELGRTGLLAPPIGFGCAAMLGRTGRSQSLRALNEAWNQGIRLFDTARSYGYGESEALLGEFLSGRRDQAIVVTKFGIVPAQMPAWKKVARSVARGVLAVAPSARSFVRKGAANQMSYGHFTPEVLTQSLDKSLRMLKTDYVDVLLMHSPPVSVLEQYDLLNSMQRLVKDGKVRVAGISGETDVVSETMCRHTPGLRAMQFPCNVFDMSAVQTLGKKNEDGHFLMANHPFGGTIRVQQCRHLLHKMAKNPFIPKELREKLQPSEDTLLADVVFSCILRETGIHVVIPAMMKVKHIQTNIQAVAASRFTPAEVEQIRKALR